jgi:class 3 adenylate cyclase
VADQINVIETRVILFMDVHNFSLAGPLLAEDQYNFLQEMYEKLGDIVVDHQGEILKYLGDAILCVFLAGSEVRAVQCALELRKTFADMASRRGLPPDTELEIGIGSGKVAIGIFGHRSLQQKDVFGEVVNQVEMIGHHRGIAITERVYSSIRTSYETRRLPDFQVKWQEEPLKVWEVREE